MLLNALDLLHPKSEDISNLRKFGKYLKPHMVLQHLIRLASLGGFTSDGHTLHR